MFGLMADIHAHQWTAFATPQPGGPNSRLQGLLDEIVRACKELNEADGYHMVMAGDVFHVRGSVDPIVLNSLIDTLALCNEKYMTQFTIIPGNHDLVGSDSTRLGSAVTALEAPHVKVTAQWCELTGSETGMEGSVFLVPWFESIDDLKAEIMRIVENIVVAVDAEHVGRCDLILHAPIDGVIEGLPAHHLTPEWLASMGFRRVFSGHYHNHKKFTPAAGRDVYSIGALAHHSWSDCKSRAGFLLVDDTTVTWRKSHLPQFVDLGQLALLDPEEVPLVVDGNFVRVKVTAAKSKEVEAARSELLAMGAVAVVVQAEPPAAPVREGAAVAAAASGASLEVSVTEFVKTMKSVPDAALVSLAAIDVLASLSSLGD